MLVDSTEQILPPAAHLDIVSRETGEREMVLARWGLVPFFTTDLKEIKGLSTINARAETITTARTWREPVKKRRCLVPVNSFFEWPKIGGSPRQTYVFELGSGAPFALAGIWDAWKDGHGHWLQSVAIVTTEAKELMADSATEFGSVVRMVSSGAIRPAETSRRPTNLRRLAAHRGS